MNYHALHYQKGAKLTTIPYLTIEQMMLVLIKHGKYNHSH